MPRLQHGWSSGSQSSTALRVGAGLTVLAAHMVVIGAIFLTPEDTKPELIEPDAVMVSVIEAPLPEMAKAEPAEDPQPQPQPEPQPPEPEPEVVPPEPDPEPAVEPEPEPEPEPVVEPEPEPEPVIPPPPVPEPAPKPKPKPQPKPQPKPKPKVEKPVAKPTPPKPVAAPAPAPTPPVAPPAGAPEGGKVTQAPVQGPPPDQPIMVSSVEYVGRRPMPEYPSMSRRFREEGRVIILVEINTSGIVQKAIVDKSSGFPRLDESALSAARKARFKPLMRNGVAYTAKAKLPFDFVMRN